MSKEDEYRDARDNSTNSRDFHYYAGLHAREQAFRQDAERKAREASQAGSGPRPGPTWSPSKSVGSSSGSSSGSMGCTPVIVVLLIGAGMSYYNAGAWIMRPFWLMVTLMAVVWVIGKANGNGSKGYLILIAAFFGLGYLLNFMQSAHLISITNNGHEVPVFPAEPKKSKPAQNHSPAHPKP